MGTEPSERAGDRAGDEGGEAPCFAPFLEALDLRDDPPRAAVAIDLDRVADGDGGAVWHLPHSGDLDANLVRLAPDGGVGEHVNGEVDVLIVVRSGGAALRVDGERFDLTAGTLVMVPRGASRAIEAGAGGVEYLSIHRRRDGITVGRR